MALAVASEYLPDRLVARGNIVVLVWTPGLSERRFELHTK